MWSFESQSRMKVKVVKWCRKKWFDHNLMYIYHKQCEILQKKSPKQLKHSISVISHWFSVEMVQKKFWGIQGMPSESWRPGLSENVVVFVAIIFLTSGPQKNWKKGFFSHWPNNTRIQKRYPGYAIRKLTSRAFWKCGGFCCKFQRKKSLSETVWKNNTATSLRFKPPYE